MLSSTGSREQSILPSGVSSLTPMVWRGSFSESFCGSGTMCLTHSPIFEHEQPDHRI